MPEEVNVPDGWTLVAGSGWLEALQRRYPDDRDVIVSIHQLESGYEIRERADSLTSGPNETLVGIRESLAAAREVMIKTCGEWDNWIIRRSTMGCN